MDDLKFEINDKDLEERVETDLRKKLAPQICSNLIIEIVPFLDSNIEIYFEEGKYRCKFCNVIGLFQDQYLPTIDYTVKFISDHNERLPAKFRVKFREIVGTQRYVLIFIPEGVSRVNNEVIQKICSKVLPNTASSEIGWSVFPLWGSDDEQKNIVSNVIKRWLADQSNPKNLRFDQKMITVDSNAGKKVQLSFIICYLVQ